MRRRCTVAVLFFSAPVSHGGAAVDAGRWRFHSSAYREPIEKNWFACLVGEDTFDAAIDHDAAGIAR